MLENQISLPVLIGEKVHWLGSGSGEPKPGKVLWIGRLPEISRIDWAVGLELDESLPFGGIDGKWNGRKLFNCKPKHGLLVPASSILPTKEAPLSIIDPIKNDTEDDLSASETSKEVTRYLGQDSFCGSLYSQVKPKPAVRKKHQQCINVKSDDNNNTHNEAIFKSHEPVTSSVSLMSHSDFPTPVTPPRSKDVVKFCKLFGYSEPTNIIIDDRHFQLYNEVKKGSAVLNFSTQIEGNQNGVRIRKTMSAYYGNDEANCIPNNESKKVSSLKSVKKKFFSKSTSQNSISAASSASDCSTHEKRLSGLFSFFRWFNKDKRKNSLPYTEEDRFPSEPASPRFKRASVAYTGSVDSIYSTATCNSFFYVPPSHYKSKHSALRRIAVDTETDTYRNRIQQVERSREINEKISLRKKYKLLGSALTLHSSVDNISLYDRSRLGSTQQLSSPNFTLNRRKRLAPQPPVIREVSPNPNLDEFLGPTINQRKNHRRSSSESAKDKKAGAYFHVKGKRKAPPPPAFVNRNKTLPRNLTIGSLRRKRLAPQPPKRNSAIFPSTSYQVDDFSEPISVVFDSSSSADTEERKENDRIGDHRPELSEAIKAVESILEVEGKTGCWTETVPEKTNDVPQTSVKNLTEGLLSEAEKQKLFEDFKKLQAHNRKHFSDSGDKPAMAHSVCNDSLKLEKGFLKPNKSNSETGNKDVEDRVIPPPSPVSPRPWYKRTIQSASTSQGVSKPEKCKVEAEESTDLPEVSSSRKIKTSTDSTSVLSFLSQNANPPNNENKRRSQLSILTNISELDREAAEIVRNERLRNLRLVSVENEKFYDSKLELPSYNQAETTNSSNSGSQKKNSTRDLISLFNAISNVTKVTVNTAFFNKESLGFFSKDASDKKACGKSKKNSDKKKSSISEPSTSVASVPERELDQDDCTFVNLHALDDIEPTLNESQNLCEEVMSEFDLRKSRTQELFEINRMKRHHSPNSSIPTITEMSESQSGSTVISPLNSATVDFPNLSTPPAPGVPVIEGNETKVDATSTNSYNAVWSCPRCTLENPMWRILCDACHLFRTTISVKPIEPPLIKPVDLSLPSVTGPLPSVAASSSSVIVKNSDKVQGITLNGKEVSDSSKSSPISNQTKKLTKDAVTESNKPSTSTEQKNDQHSSSVEAPPINFEEAKMKFSNLESKVVGKANFPDSSPSKYLIGANRDEMSPYKKEQSEGLVANEKIEILKGNLAQTEKLRNIPTSSHSILDDTCINTNTREEKLIRDKIVPSNDEELLEVRKARVAFFDKKATENNLNKKLNDGSEGASSNEKKAMDHAEREKLKLMLREMKHSLAKQESVDEKVITDKTSPATPSPTDERKFGAIKKVKKLDLNSKKLSFKKVSDYLDGMEKEKTAEAYLVTSDAIFEDHKLKASEPSTSSEKVSISVQTSSIVRKTDLPPNIFSKPPVNNVVPSKNVVAPVIVEEYNIKNGVAHSSIKRDRKPISIDAIELIRAQDFAGLKDTKTQNHAVSHIYANIPSDASVSESYSQISDPTHLKSSNLSLNKPGLFTHSANSSSNTSNNANQSPPENVATLAINRLLRRLETAIAKGQHHQAAALAKELARLKISCSVVRQKAPSTNAPNTIIINLFVEDKVAHQGPFPLTVDPAMKVADLKLKVEAELEVPVRFQRWILGKQLVTDDSRTLQQLGVNSSGCPFFLYLVAPESPKQESLSSNISNEKYMNGQQEPPVSASAPPLTLSSSDIGDQSLHANTISGISNILEEVVEENNSEDFDNADTSLIENDKQLPEPFPTSSAKENNVSTFDWKCSMCTLMNSPTCTSCAACTNLRPGEYQLPETYIENKQDNEAPVAENQEAGTSAEVKLSNYHELLNLDKSDLIPNMDEFECPVCLSLCKPRDGAVLRECLHTFCKVCLANMVEFCEEPEVKCPFQDSSYSCDSTLQEREIKALVTAEQYEMHLAKSIAQAETKIGNTFHCKTPDCRGWCIFEDNVNYFVCPVCNRNNCLTCQAIHTGINCRQYQEQMKQESETNVDAKRTRDMLEEMVDRGEAMACPSCQVVLMKKWGCDWVRCSMCKTEICWVRRCARWGPKGRGDTSGGCQCGVNGVKCHPKCTYCH